VIERVELEFGLAFIGVDILSHLGLGETPLEGLWMDFLVGHLFFGPDFKLTSANRTELPGV
jgi:hypothetical protein